MIFYYTGTGNGKYIAEILSKKTGDDIVNINMFTRDKKELSVLETESVTVVTPVYFWGLPTSVLEFSKILGAKKCGYTALFLECGGSTGNAQKLFVKNCDVDAVFAITAVDNYCPMYAVRSGDDSIVTKKLDQIVVDTENIADSIIAKKKGDFNKIKGPMAGLITPIMYTLYNTTGRKTKFKVTDDCIGCGMCSNSCNTKAIEMKDDKPVWTKAKCDMCLMCLMRCPKHAISIGKSKNNGTYVNPRVKF